MVPAQVLRPTHRHTHTGFLRLCKLYGSRGIGLRGECQGWACWGVVGCPMDRGVLAVLCIRVSTCPGYLVVLGAWAFCVSGCPGYMGVLGVPVSRCPGYEDVPGVCVLGIQVCLVSGCPVFWSVLGIWVSFVLGCHGCLGVSGVWVFHVSGCTRRLSRCPGH